MKSIVSLFALVGVLALAVPYGAVAQHGGGYSRVYDPASVETVSGQVQSVETGVRGWHGAQGVHLVLNTRRGPLIVHLGPEWFLKRHHFTVEANDVVTVHGSRVMLAGEHVLIAARITKGKKTLELRDTHGVPVWRGSRYAR